MYHIDYDGNDDNIYNKYPFVKLFILLTDTTEINGATTIVKGSRDNLILPNNYRKGKRVNDNFITKNYSKKNVIRLIGDKGDYFLARTDGWHKGGWVQKGSRLILMCSYISSENIINRKYLKTNENCKNNAIKLFGREYVNENPYLFRLF